VSFVTSSEKLIHTVNQQRLGTQQFSDEKLLAQMEVDCKQRQLGTVRVSEDGENWSNFDPRWTLVDRNSSLSRLVDYTCQLAIAEQ
jgi:hypothetical protein